MANYQNFTGYRDAWGRVTQIDYRRRDDGMQAVRDFDYSYDYASNIIYQEDHSAAALDELYSYDTLHRLTAFERGDLNGNKNSITGTPTREQTWALAAIGNWQNSPATSLAIDSNDNGSAGIPSDARTHTSVNEIDTIDPEGAVGSFDPVYDDAGNLRILPDRADPDNDATKHVYDYRNRLIEVWETEAYDENDPESTNWGNDPVARYYYDGLNRKIKKVLDTGTDVVYIYNGLAGA